MVPKKVLIKVKIDKRAVEARHGKIPLSRLRQIIQDMVNKHFSGEYEEE